MLIFFLFTYINTWNFLKSESRKWKWNLAGHPVQIKLKFFYIKNIRRISIEMWSMWFALLYQDVNKHGHAGISL